MKSENEEMKNQRIHGKKKRFLSETSSHSLTSSMALPDRFPISALPQCHVG
jgi:hypothetical protein